MRIAGVDIGGTSIKAGILEDGKIVYKTSAKTPHGDPASVCDLIAGMLQGQEIDCVGVGTAGSVQQDGDNVAASNLGWENVPLRRMLTERLEHPVCIGNDAQAALMAEWLDGECKGAECAIYLTLGTGIGGAMIVGGKPYRGRNHLGAEFGHMIIRKDGPLCACGRRGCLELYASAAALGRMAGNRPVKDVIELAKSGDADMLRCFKDYVRMLCIGLNNLVMAFDPEVIVLGGGLSGAGDFLASHCQKELARMFSGTTDPLLCQIRIAKHQNDAGILGAALLAQQKFFSDPS